MDATTMQTASSTPPTPPTPPSIAESLDLVRPPSESRLSMPTPVRIPAAGLMGFGTGYTLGLIQGSRTAQLRFRAEHAHKMPTTTTGWYLYHKSKNYHTMYGGLREGFRMGGRVGFWSLMAFSLESTIDRCRGSTDLLSTVLASLTVAGGFSLWNRFSLPTAARTARQGLLFGLVYGGLQDLVGMVRGRRIGYVEFFRRKFGSKSAASIDDGHHQTWNKRDERAV